jgi:photosystem II stability/assembly factor-like uncharacterized protein
MKTSFVSKSVFKQLSILSLFAVLVCNSLNAQIVFTPYDELPGINKSYKPAYDENYPSWAKAMYEYPVNYNQVNTEFELYLAQHKDVKSPIIRYFKIWRRVVAGYTLPDGTIQMPDVEEINRKTLAVQQDISKKKKSANQTNSDWTFLGPKETFWLNETNGGEFVQTPCPWQANVYSFDVALTDNNILYCGTETGFVNKTIDKGKNWVILGQDYPFGGSITAVAIDPVNPDIAYVSGGNQIHKTVDGGISWTPMLTSKRFGAERLRIDPNNPLKLVAAAGSGIFVSNDGGATWANPWTAQSWDIEFKPDDSNIILGICTGSGNLFQMVSSTDAGATFTAISSFPSYTNESGALLAVTPANPNIVFAAMLCKEGAETVPFIVKGTLENDAWTFVQKKKGEYGSVGGLGGFTNGQGYFDLVLEVSPVNQDIVFFGTCTLWKSVNGGGSFSGIGGYRGNFSIHPDQQDMKLLPSGETWIATDGGFTLTTDNFVSTDNAVALNRGLVGSDMWGFDQGWNEDIIVGGRYHNGNTALSDMYGNKALRMGGAESATGWVIQGKSRHVAFNDLGNGWILPKYADREPEGRFVFSKFPNMEEYGGRRGNMVFHTNYYNTIYLGEGSSVWKSTDLGKSFDMLYTFPGMVLWFQISYSNPLVMYADIVGKGLYKTTNGGVSWVARPKLTDDTLGTSYWNGKLFFAISPSNENVIYACLQNGTWSADAGKIYKSTNGGLTWTDWTSGLPGTYNKCLVIQPAADGTDIVYLFTTSKNGAAASVYYRDQTMTDWVAFANNFPAGMNPNLAIPFFRDSKLRVGGNGSVWESPMVEPDFKPIINPWVEKPLYTCTTDTIYFDDHSILNHAGAGWEWTITPAPAYINDTKIRNPKMVAATPGKYSVTLTVTKDGQTYSKTIADLFEVTSCPSITDCSNPADVPKKDWKLVYADSQQSGDPANYAFDGKPATKWHTTWSPTETPFPHEIQIDLGRTYQVHTFTYLARQDGSPNGRVKNYELYISDNTSDWGNPVKTGSFSDTDAPQTVTLAAPSEGKYMRLKALSEINGNAWASAAELSIVGCEFATGIKENLMDQTISAYPVPTSGSITLELPKSQSCSKYNYSVISSSGLFVDGGLLEVSDNKPVIDFSTFASGIYFVSLVDSKGIVYRVKVLKQ